jgi:hypothetical protein
MIICERKVTKLVRFSMDRFCTRSLHQATLCNLLIYIYETLSNMKTCKPLLQNLIYQVHNSLFISMNICKAQTLRLYFYELIIILELNI